MASKIALMEDEYSTLQEKLASCHEQILEYIESIVEQLQGLSSVGGDFYTDSISPKVDLLCEELNAAKAFIKERMVYTPQDFMQKMASAKKSISIRCQKRKTGLLTQGTKNDIT